VLSGNAGPRRFCTSAEDGSRRNQRRAGELWREATPIDGTHAACYLEWRHVLEPALEAGHGVLWFHPNCPFGQDTRHPCLLARCLAGRRFSAGSRAQGIREEYILRVVVQTRVRPPYDPYGSYDTPPRLLTVKPRVAPSVETPEDEAVWEIAARSALVAR
jgi:hypothetical protein